MDKHPSLFEILEKFNTEEKCIEHFERIRWPQGPSILKCSRNRKGNSFRYKGRYLAETL